MAKPKKAVAGAVQITLDRDGMKIDVNDGLDTADLDSYCRQFPCAPSEGEASKAWCQHEFAKMLKDRDEHVETLLKEYLPENATIDDLRDLLVTTLPPMVGHYAVKYMMHRKLVDHYLQIGEDFAAYRELYLLGATWAEAKFKINYLGDARHGRDSSKKLEQARAQRNADERDEARRRYADWQRMANEIWRRPGHRGWSKSRVATQIKEEAPEIKLEEGTIAKKITRPK